MFDFPVKSKYEVQDDYATRLFLFTHKENIPVGDFTRAINEGKISRRSMENLISGIEQRDGKFTRLLDGDELTAYLNKLKRALRNTSNKNKVLDEKIEAFLDGNYRVLVEHLEKLKEQRNMDRTLKLRESKMKKVKEYLKGLDDETREQLTERLSSIHPFFADTDKIELQRRFTPSLVLEYFNTLTTANIPDNMKRLAVQSPHKKGLNNAKRATAFTGEKFQITPAFEFFMENDSLNLSKVKTKKVKTSWMDDMVVTILDSNDFSDFDGMTITSGGVQYDVVSELRNIKNRDDYAKAGSVKDGSSRSRKASVLRNIRNGSEQVPKSVLNLIRNVGMVDESMEIPIEDMMKILYPENFDSVDDILKKYDLKDDDALDEITDRLDESRSRFKFSDYTDDSGDEITFKEGTLVPPKSDRPVFVELVFESEEVGSDSLTMNKDDEFLDSLNDREFGNKMSLADYLETIMHIDRHYNRNRKLRDAILTYKKNEDYDELINEFESNFNRVKREFVENIEQTVRKVLLDEELDKVHTIIENMGLTRSGEQ